MRVLLLCLLGFASISFFFHCSHPQEYIPVSEEAFLSELSEKEEPFEFLDELPLGEVRSDASEKVNESKEREGNEVFVDGSIREVVQEHLENPVERENTPLERRAEEVPEGGEGGFGEASPENMPERAAQKRILGKACNYHADCISGVCKDPGFLGKKLCTQPCIPQVLPCAKGSLCELHSGTKGFCVPVCQDHKDCAPFPAIPVCNPEKHCWKRWKSIGARCSVSVRCLSDLCIDPGGLSYKVCSKVCTQHADCSANGGYCLKKTGKLKGHCMRACKVDDDCKPLSFLDKCQKDGYCWQ